MKLVRELAALPAELKHGAVTIGNFDGVHLGHARIIEHLVAEARAVDGPAVVFTFDPHPVRLLRPAQAPPPLTWTARKLDLLAELGIDGMIAYPTDEALLSLSHQDFFGRIVRDSLAARAIIEGPNFRFGRGREGTIDRLESLARSAGMNFRIVEPLIVGGEIVSSSRARGLVAAGKIDEVRALLTRPYRIRGMVTHGAGRGAKLGFPTANVDAIDTIVPGVGVYAGVARVAGNVAPAAIHIGPNATFGEHALKVEVHLIDFQGELYGEPIETDFLSRLRDVRAFAAVEALKSQLALDVAAARRVAAEAI